MPYTEEQKRNILVNAGLDPSTHYYDEVSSSAFPKSAPQPSFNPPVTDDVKPVIKPPVTGNFGPVETAARTFGSQAAPAVAGGLTTGMLLASGALDATGAGAIAGVPLALLAGYLASRGTKVAQDEVAPNLFGDKAKLEASQKENPRASMLGGLATIPLSGFRPSVQGFKNIGTAGKDIVTGLATHELNPEAIKNIANVVTPAALGAGMAYAPAAETGIRNFMSDEPPVPVPYPGLGEVLTSTAAGAAANRVNTLGKLYGFENPVANVNRPGNPEMTTRVVEPPAPPNPNPNNAVYPLSSRGYQKAQQFGEIPTGKVTKTVDQTGKVTKTPIVENIPVKSAEEAAWAMEASSLTKSSDYENALREKARQEVEDDFKRVKEEETKKVLSNNSIKLVKEGIQNNLLKNQINTESEPLPKVFTPEGESVYPDNAAKQKAEVEANKTLTPAEQAQHEIDLASGDKYSTLKKLAEAGKQKTEEGQATVTTGVKTPEVQPKLPSQEVRTLASQHGINEIQVHKPGHDIVMPNGEVATGALSKDGIIKLATNRRSDVDFHEILHKVYENLQNTETGHAKRLAKSAGAFKEEPIIESAGTRAEAISASRSGKGNTADQAKLWWEDFKSGIRNRLGRAKADDVSNLLARRMFDAPNYYESGLAAKDIQAISTGNKFSSSTEKGNESNAIQKPSTEGILQRLQERSGEESGGKNLPADEGNQRIQSSEQRTNEQGSPGSGEHYSKSKEEQSKESESLKGENKPFKRQDIFTSRFNAVGEKFKDSAEHGPTAKEITDNLQRFHNDERQIGGALQKGTAHEFTRLNKEQAARVDEYLWSKRHGLPTDIELSPLEREVADNVKATHKEVGEASIGMGMKVVDAKTGKLREMKLDPNAYPDVVDPKYTQAAINHTPELSKLKALHEDWIVNKMGEDSPKTRNQAKSIVNDFTSNIGKPTKSSAEFAALRRAEGFGLPRELRENNPAVAFSRYGRRAARDMSAFKNLESNPRMQKALGIKPQEGDIPDLPDVSDLSNDPIVVAAMRSVNGIRDAMSLHPRLEATKKLVNAIVLGPKTGLNNLIQIPGNVASYQGGMRKGIEALFKMGERSDRAMENGVVRDSFHDLAKTGDISGSDDWYVNSANKMAEIFSRYSGRELSNKFEKYYSYSVGESLSEMWIANAKNGDVQSKALLRRFGENNLDFPVEDLWSKEYKPNHDDIGRLAARISEGISGSYSAADLPSWALEGWAAPFASLARFNIEKANTIYKDAIIPLKSGNPIPFMKYTGVSLLVGAAMEKVWEELSGHKGGEANIEETLAAGDKKDMAYKVTSLLAAAGWFGSVGSLAKLGVNAEAGKSLKYSNPLSLPAGSIIIDGVGHNLVNLYQALKNGDDPIKTTLGFFSEFGKLSNQAYRLGYDRLHPDDTERKALRRDIRVFNELTHRTEPDSADYNTNPLKDLQKKDFHKAETPEEAKAIAIPLWKQSYDAWKAGDITLQQLKHDSESFKSAAAADKIAPPEDDKIAWKDFMDFISKTQSPQAAVDLKARYIHEKGLAHAKAKMIPKVGK